MAGEVFTCSCRELDAVGDGLCEGDAETGDCQDHEDDALDKHGGHGCLPRDPSASLMS